MRTEFERKVRVKSRISLSGKTIVFTGTLKLMTRSVATAKATNAGAKVTGSVSKNVDLLVAGPERGRSSSLRRASVSK